MTGARLRSALAVLGLIVLQLAGLGTAAAQQMEPRRCRTSSMGP